MFRQSFDKVNDTPEGRTFAIGDIHGDFGALKKLIESLDLQATDHLVFLGDLIDRGPDSKAVIDYLIELDQKFECRFIMGNHEEYLIEAVFQENMDVANSWISRGGRETLDSYGVSRAEELFSALPREHLTFFLGLLPAYETQTHIFSHAGWQTGEPMSRQTRTSLRYQFMQAATPDKDFDKKIIVGHSAVINGMPARKGNFICIDTIQAEEGYLTAYDIKGNQFYQANSAGSTRQFDEAECFDENRHVPQAYRRQPQPRPQSQLQPEFQPEFQTESRLESLPMAHAC